MQCDNIIISISSLTIEYIDKIMPRNLNVVMAYIYNSRDVNALQARELSEADQEK